MQRSLEEVKQQLQELKPMLKKRFKVETIDIFGSPPTPLDKQSAWLFKFD